MRDGAIGLSDAVLAGSLSMPSLPDLDDLFDFLQDPSFDGFAGLDDEEFGQNPSVNIFAWPPSNTTTNSQSGPTVGLPVRIPPSLNFDEEDDSDIDEEDLDFLEEIPSHNPLLD
jgi:hypothetical protein